MACSISTYCVNTELEAYDGEFNYAGMYNGQDYFTGGSYFIYYSSSDGNLWCLSNSLGGSCLQFGPLGSTSTCPDLDESFFSSGSCPTVTTTTTSPCDAFDFTAIFDCLIPPTTTTTTTIPPTTTTTTTLFDACKDVGMVVTLSAYTTTTTTLPVTTTTTTQIDRPCIFSGSVQFNIFDEYMRCGNSKLFKDCISGLEYISSDVLLTPFGTSPIQNYVYKLDVNGVTACAVFIGLVDNISGIDQIIIEEELGAEVDGACLDCVPDPVPECITIHSECGVLTVNPIDYLNGKPHYVWSFNNLPGVPFEIYWDNSNNRWVVQNQVISTPAAYLNLDSPLPSGSLVEWEDTGLYFVCISTAAGFYTSIPTTPCPSPDPQICYCYILYGGDLFSQTVFSLDGCDGKLSSVTVPSGTTGYTCSYTTPVVDSGDGIVLGILSTCSADCPVPVPTPTPEPCVLYQFNVYNGSILTNEFTYQLCNGSLVTENINSYQTLIVCSTTTPTSPSGNVEITSPPTPLSCS